jgi:cystathionine gamma-synthase
VWADENDEHSERTTQIPAALSVSFGYDDVNEWLEVAPGQTPGHIIGGTQIRP